MDWKEELNTPPVSLSAEKWQNLIGKKLIDTPNINSDKDIVSTEQLPNPHRVLPPGALATRDLIPNRLNVSTDSESIITSVYYG
ncbi:hypothetical protein CANCADRAFT_126930 [Tortispora caseinolytica NRRL Y-17796]|uniref:Uncharacterized protein n=1 Tax=Tortispora caseinolytica NRRL Y-17796 TaxID=767744 RepID=A0A1E4TA61_9ASCO|nr:hypothetical protein CANCADRAFT_126930 [Tortispora caseinolytica NRRL Y-17796]